MAGEIRIYIVEDDVAGSDSLSALLQARGYAVRSFSSGEEWLAFEPPDTPSCIILDLNLGQGLSGLDVLRRMAAGGLTIPVIMISAYGDIRTALTAVKLGAVDFLEKPCEHDELIQNIEAAVRQQGSELVLRAEVMETERLVKSLSVRERQILAMVCEGIANKVIAKRLDLGLRTVESCRAQLLKTFGSISWPELIAKVTRLETYRAKQPRVLPPKFLGRPDSGKQGRANGIRSDLFTD